MGKGSPVVQVRIPQAELNEIDSVIAKVNERRKEEPYDRSSFIRKCIQDGLKHLNRGRYANRKGNANFKPQENKNVD